MYPLHKPMSPQSKGNNLQGVEHVVLKHAKLYFSVSCTLFQYGRTVLSERIQYLMTYETFCYSLNLTWITFRFVSLAKHNTPLMTKCNYVIQHFYK